MRIVYLAAGAGQMYCGACARDINMVRGLIARGHDVEVVPLYTPLRVEGEEPLPIAPVFLGGINAYLQQYSGFFRRLPPFMDRVLDSPALLRLVSRFAISTKPADLGPMTVSVLSGRDGRQNKEVQRLLSHLGEQAPADVFIITNTLLSGLAPALANEFGVPVLCGLQGEDGFIEAMTDPHRARAQELMRQNMAHVNVVIAPGESYGAKMVEFLAVSPEKVRVVRTGVDIHAYRFEGPRPREPFTLGYLSVITPKKGLDILVSAWVKLVVEHGRQVRLRVAGRVLDKLYWQKIQDVVSRSGVAGMFDYVGEVNTSGKIEFLRSCSAFSVPSIYPEARGMAVLEALATGVPVVAPAHGVFPEMIELTQGGVLVEPGGPQDHAAALAESVMHMMDNPDEADEMGRRAASGVAEHHHPDSTVDAMVSVLTEVVGGA